MAAQTQYASLPFDEAIAFFRGKVNIPTRRWNDLWQGMHARGFMSAGAMKDELLCDLRGAVDKAIAEGTTIAQFRKDFDALVQKHGWAYKGGRGWRTRVIYDTNIRQAYNAGREAQINAPGLKKLKPYSLYRHGDSINPRPKHLAWDGLVLPSDDPWWDTHTPMNGWGCKCKKFAVGKRDLEKMGKSGPDKAPDDGTYQWTDKQGRTHTIPNGIDPGFDYNVGQAAWGRQISEKAMTDWQAKGAAAWERLTPGDFRTAGRPETLPLHKPVATEGKAVKTRKEAAAALRIILGGEEKIYSFTHWRGVGAAHRYDILVNAETLAEHIDLDRGRWLPFLPETLENPAEVWMAFERHKGTGQVVLRQRIVKAIDLGKKRGLLVVAQAVRGRLEAWTMVPVDNLAYLNKQRAGMLVWPKP